MKLPSQNWIVAMGILGALPSLATPYLERSETLSGWVLCYAPLLPLISWTFWLFTFPSLATDAGRLTGRTVSCGTVWGERVAITLGMLAHVFTSWVIFYTQHVLGPLLSGPPRDSELLVVSALCFVLLFYILGIVGCCACAWRASVITISQSRILNGLMASGWLTLPIVGAYFSATWSERLDYFWYFGQAIGGVSAFYLLNVIRNRIACHHMGLQQTDS